MGYRRLAYDLQVVDGDFRGNVRKGFELFLGSHVISGPTNNNGQRLLEICASNYYTWTSNSGPRPRRN